jgi:hypothetical protein
LFCFQPVLVASLVTSDHGKFANTWCTVERDVALPWDSSQSVSTSRVLLLPNDLYRYSVSQTRWRIAVCYIISRISTSELN